MINLEVTDPKNQNMIYSLVKSFYPENDVIITKKDKSEVQLSPINEEILAANTPTMIKVSPLEDRISLEIKFISGESLIEEVIVNQCQREEYKEILLKFIYNKFSRLTKKELPWGVLTGIRPTKIAINKLINNVDEEYIYKHMREKLLCSKEKATLSIDIAKRELELLNESDYKNGYSLYIGIPFCPSTCLYCSFTSYPVEEYKEVVEDYLHALEKEISYGAKIIDDKKLNTIYLGGGTPTTLSAKQLDMLITTVKKYFNMEYVKEFCVEAGRPDSITKEKLEVLKKYGVDRISINPQSMNDKTLQLIGRNHSPDDIIESYKWAKELAFDNINMDLIIGLPGEGLEDVLYTLDEIKKLNPDSITIHTLALKRAARLNINKGMYKDLKPLDVEAMFNATKSFATENGYIPYYLYRQKSIAENLENIGYSRPGKEGLYNILIIEEKQSILALGAGGASKFVYKDETGKDVIERFSNLKNVEAYIERIDEMIEKKHEFYDQHKPKNKLR